MDLRFDYVRPLVHLFFKITEVNRILESGSLVNDDLIDIVKQVTTVGKLRLQIR